MIGQHTRIIMYTVQLTCTTLHYRFNNLESLCLLWFKWSSHNLVSRGMTYQGVFLQKRQLPCNQCLLFMLICLFISEKGYSMCYNSSKCLVQVRSCVILYKGNMEEIRFLISTLPIKTFLTWTTLILKFLTWIFLNSNLDISNLLIWTWYTYALH